MVARDLHKKAALDWNLPEELHPPEGSIEGRPGCSGMHASAAGVVGDMEETLCGRLLTLLSVQFCFYVKWINNAIVATSVIGWN